MTTTTSVFPTAMYAVVFSAVSRPWLWKRWSWFDHVARLGFEKICHQPCEASSDAGRIEVANRPTVGTSQSRPTTTSSIWIGALATVRRIRDETLSRGAG